jgi:transposase
MPTRYHIEKDQLAEIEEARKKNQDKNKEKRLKVLVLHAQGEKRSAIAEKTGFVTSYISEIVAKYMKHGLASIIDNHYAGNRRNLTYEEEKALLEPFRKAAAAGQVVEISAIKAAYEARTGTILGDNNKGQIYRVLQRHGWRKIMPRSKHPNKADDEAIEASKKLTKLSQGRWKILQAEESD